MHILAALTDGPTIDAPPAKGRAAKEQGDFETAFMALDEVALELGVDVAPEEALADMPQEEDIDAPDVEAKGDLAATDEQIIAEDEMNFGLSDDDSKRPDTTDNGNIEAIERDAATDLPEPEIAIQATPRAERDRVENVNRPSDQRAEGPHKILAQMQHAAPVTAKPSQDAPTPSAMIPLDRPTLEKPMQNVPPTGHSTATIPATHQPVGQAQLTALAMIGLPVGKPIAPQTRILQSETSEPRPNLKASVDTAGSPQPFPAQTVAMPATPITPQPLRTQAQGLVLDAGLTFEPAASTNDPMSLGPSARTDTSLAAPVTQSVPLHHPQLPQHIARQMAEAMKAGSDGPVDVALSPEELGKVRMRITLQDGGIMIHILAERAETLDLMRKNADQLAREFEDMGFGSVDFGFAASDEDAADTKGEQPSDQTPAMNTDTADKTLAAAGPVLTQQTHATQGVDIRL